MLQHADRARTARELKTTSNCANPRCHAEDEPWELVLTLTLSVVNGKRKDGEVGVRVLADVLCFGLWLNADLVGFPHRRRSKHVLELGDLLFVVATGFVRRHIGFCFPEGN